MVGLVCQPREIKTLEHRPAMKSPLIVFLKLLAILMAACLSTRAAFAAGAIQLLGDSPVLPPTGPSLYYSMAGGLKLSAASAGGSANLLYLQTLSISNAVNSGVLSGQTPLNSPGAPAPLPVAAPGVASTPITARSNIYDISGYDPNTGIIT